MLPELELQRRIVVEAAAGADLLFAEQRIYLLALASFVVFYGLEHMVLVSRQRVSANATGTVDAAYITHLAGHIAYGTLIGYLLVERADRGWLPLAIYTFAMAVHFLIVDHALYEEHKVRTGDFDGQPFGEEISIIDSPLVARAHRRVVQSTADSATGSVQVRDQR